MIVILDGMDQNATLLVQMTVILEVVMMGWRGLEGATVIQDMINQLAQIVSLDIICLEHLV